MPPPRFITCGICGKGFGSASIDIHIPQCYDKAIKRWQLNPTGPRPVMPAPRGGGGGGGGGGARGGRSRGGFGGGSGLDSQPVGTGSAAARGLRMDEAPVENLNLHPCSRCGRKFNYDRISYHESVCKGDIRRPVFDSSAQRAVTDDDGFGGGRSYGYSAPRSKRGGRSGGQKGGYTSRNTYQPPPTSTWRQQHEEFQAAMRAARQSGNSAKDMWGTGPSMGGGGGGGGGMRSRAGPPPSQPRQMPASVARQNQMAKSAGRGRGTTSRTAGGGARSSFGGGSGGRFDMPAQAPPARRRGGGGGGGGFGGGGPRFEMMGGGGGGGGGFGGGGGGKIINDNTSSLGMLQAMGRA